jgi:hypothetical protein
MLGDQIGELRGKRTGRRALSVDSGFKMEVSFEDAGKLLGADVQEVATYCSTPRPDGTIFGEGQGMMVTSSGEAATWKGQGVGKFTASGGVSFRGAIYFSSAAPKFARLNAVASLYEFEVDAEGNTHTKLWEWK